MSAFILINDGTDRASWLEDRRGGISATDAARIMTGGGRIVRREKVEGESFSGNAATDHGREREPVLAAFAERQFGLRPSAALLERADSPGDLATPDALGDLVVDGLSIVETEPLVGGRYRTEAFGEFKTTIHDWPTWDDVPKRYMWQVVWQFLVTGASVCHFVFEAHEGFRALHMEPRVFTIYRDDVAEQIEQAQARVAEWRDVADGIVPEGLEPLDGMLLRLEAAQEEADEAAAAVALIQDEIRALIEARGLPVVGYEGPGATVTWTGERRKSRRFDAKAFAAKYPATHRRFMAETTEARPRLTITKARS